MQWILHRAIELRFSHSWSMALSIVSYRKEKRKGVRQFWSTRKAPYPIWKSFLFSAGFLETSVRPNLWQAMIRGSIIRSWRSLDFFFFRFYFFQTWKLGIFMETYNEEITKRLLIYPTKNVTWDEIGNLVSRSLHRDENRCNHKMCYRVRAKNDFWKEKNMRV